MIQHVLYPAEVGVAFGWGAVFPAHVIFQLGMPPVLDIEGRIGHDVIGPQVRVLVIQEAVGVLLAEVKIDAPDGHVHCGQLPGGGVALLAVDGDMLFLFGCLVVFFVGMGFDELVIGDKEATGAHGRIIDTAVVGFEHFDNQGDDAFGRVILAALFAFGQGELAKKVFVDMAENVFAVQIKRMAIKFGLAEAGIGEFVDQFREIVVFNLILAHTRQNAF